MSNSLYNRHNEVIASDLCKVHVIRTTLNALFTEYFAHLNRTKRGMVDLLPDSYAGFQIKGKTFSIDDTDKVKIKEILPDYDFYEKALMIYNTHKNVMCDYGIIEHFLSMFLNKVPTTEAFFDIFPENHLQNLHEQHATSNGWGEFKKKLLHCITYRQNNRPTKPHQYEIFLSDQEDRILLVKKYIVDTMLI